MVTEGGEGAGWEGEPRVFHSIRDLQTERGGTWVELSASDRVPGYPFYSVTTEYEISPVSVRDSDTGEIVDVVVAPQVTLTVEGPYSTLGAILESGLESPGMHVDTVTAQVEGIPGTHEAYRQAGKLAQVLAALRLANAYNES